MSDDTDDVLASIDAALAFDGATEDDEFPDAMRWVPPEDRTVDCDVCQDTGRVQWMTEMGPLDVADDGTVPCIEGCTGSRPDTFGRVLVGPEVGARCSCGDPLCPGPMIAVLRQMAIDRLLFGSSFMDGVGRRVSPVDAAVVRDEQGRATGISVGPFRGVRPIATYVDEAASFGSNLRGLMNTPGVVVGRGRLMVGPAGADPSDASAWTDVGTMSEPLSFSDLDFDGDADDGETLRSAWPTSTLTMTATVSPEAADMLAGLFRAPPPPPPDLSRLVAGILAARATIRRMVERFQPTIDAARRLTPLMPPEDVRERALRLRQNRSTGPESVPYRNRGRSERRTPPSPPARRRRAGQHVHVPPTRRR